MSMFLVASVSGSLLGMLMAFLSLFMILLVLVQRGKGGGLAGALGGPGGQSAFGSKAGDTFTVITIVVAAVWGFTCAFTMWLLGTHAPAPIADEDTQSEVGGFESTDDVATPGIGLSGSDTGLTSGDTKPNMDLVPANSESSSEGASGDANTSDDADTSDDTGSADAATSDDAASDDAASGESAEGTEGEPSDAGGE